MEPLTDLEILRKWSVDDLDMLHHLIGYGEMWLKSDRREHLKHIENGELEMLENIFGDQYLEWPEHPRTTRELQDECKTTIDDRDRPNWRQELWQAAQTFQRQMKTKHGFNYDGIEVETLTYPEKTHKVVVTLRVQLKVEA